MEVPQPSKYATEINLTDPK